MFKPYTCTEKQQRQIRRGSGQFWKCIPQSWFAPVGHRTSVAPCLESPKPSASHPGGGCAMSGLKQTLIRRLLTWCRSWRGSRGYFFCDRNSDSTAKYISQKTRNGRAEIKKRKLSKDGWNSASSILMNVPFHPGEVTNMKAPASTNAYLCGCLIGKWGESLDSSILRQNCGIIRFCWSLVFFVQPLEGFTKPLGVRKDLKNTRSAILHFMQPNAEAI